MRYLYKPEITKLFYPFIWLSEWRQMSIYSSQFHLYCEIVPMNRKSNRKQIPSNKNQHSHSDFHWQIYLNANFK